VVIYPVIVEETIWIVLVAMYPLSKCYRPTDDFILSRRTRPSEWACKINNECMLHLNAPSK
jgi:hypothetical protein